MDSQTVIGMGWEWDGMGWHCAYVAGYLDSGWVHRGVFSVSNGDNYYVCYVGLAREASMVGAVCPASVIVECQEGRLK
jgi:hypothetical protein